MSFLVREVKYLENKIKRWRPKEKPKKDKKSNETSSGETIENPEKQDENQPEEQEETPPEKVDGAEVVDEEEAIVTGEGTIEEPEILEEQTIDPTATETTDKAEEKNHSEL